MASLLRRALKKVGTTTHQAKRSRSHIFFATRRFGAATKKGLVWEIPSTMDSDIDLANRLFADDKFEEAEPLFKKCLKAAMLIHLALAWDAAETSLPETAGSKPGVGQSFTLESLIQTHVALQALRHDRKFAMQIFQGENKGYRLRILLTILFCLTGARCEVKCLPQIEQQRRFKTRCFSPQRFFD